MFILAYYGCERFSHILASVCRKSSLPNLYHVRLAQIMFSTSNYGWQWFLYIMYSGCLPVSFPISNRNHVGFYHTVTVLSGYSWHRIPDIVRSTLAAVVALNNKWLWILEYKLFQSPCNPLHRFRCQRSHRPDSIFLFDLFRGVKDAGARQGKV